jgi:site-specific recombinase XerD
MVVVKQFYDHLLQEEMIADNPASDIEVNGQKKDPVSFTGTS